MGEPRERDIEAALDPNDATAFMTTLTFTEDGRFTGTMTPIPETVSTALNLIQSLGENVDSLVKAEKLDGEEGEELIEQLDEVAKQIGRDRIDKACEQLDEFIEEVNELISEGELDAEDGDPLPLIEQAEAIGGGLGFGGCDAVLQDDDDDDDDDGD